MLKILSNRFIFDSIKNSFWGTIGRILGLFIPFFIAIYFGVNSETDVFLFCYSIVLFLLNILVPNIERLILPTIIQLQEEEIDIGNFIGNYLLIFSIIILIFSSLLIIFANILIDLFTNFNGTEITKLIQYYILFFPFILGMILSTAFIATLNSYEKYTVASISPLIRSSFIIITIISLHNQIGVISVIVGYNIGEFLRIIFFFLYFKRKNFPNIKIDFIQKSVFKIFFNNLVPLMIASLLININTIIGKIMASWLDPGSISILHYSERIYMIPFSLIIIGFLPVFTKQMSVDVYQKKTDNKIIINKIKKIFLLLLIITTFITIIYLFLNDILINIINLIGEFNNTDSKNIYYAVLFLLIGLGGQIIFIFCIQLLIIFDLTKKVIIVGFITGIVNLILNWIFMWNYGTSGIAFATSLSYIISNIYLFIVLKKIIIIY